MFLGDSRMYGRLKTFAFLLAFALLATTSCNRGPTPIKQPSIDPASAGKLAIEEYDKNGDGKIAGDELDKAPALKAALPRLDTDGDGAVSADEVAARVNAWKGMRTGMTTVHCHITMDGQPLVGAKVIFEPETFLGDNIKTAVATSNPYGDAAPSIPPAERPQPNLPGGAHFGLYKVRISLMVNGKETVPARYNTETTLGQEVSYDDPAMQNHNMQFALKSK
jgi:EF hand